MTNKRKLGAIILLEEKKKETLEKMKNKFEIKL